MRPKLVGTTHNKHTVSWPRTRREDDGVVCEGMVVEFFPVIDTDVNLKTFIGHFSQPRRLKNNFRLGLIE